MAAIGLPSQSCCAHTVLGCPYLAAAVEGDDLMRAVTRRNYLGSNGSF